MNNIHQQLKLRRKALGLKQDDMRLRIGMARQQYQRMESGGNPRLNTLELAARGLKMELMLIPREQLAAVRELLASGIEDNGRHEGSQVEQSPNADHPWRGVLED